MLKASWVLSVVLTMGALAMAQPATTKPVGSEKNPVAISFVEKITIDGDLADWAKIAPLPAPFAKKDAGSCRMAWNEDGLYAALDVKDDKIEVDAATPWSADCIEFWIEKDFARAGDKTDNSAQYVFMANPDNKKDAKAQVVVAWGGDKDTPEGVQTAWKKTDTGYVIEFFIPKKVMAPAKLVDGTKIGMNYSIDNAGKPVEQFFSDKDTDTGYANPSTWGALILKK
jgi:hypothetical protein